MSKPIIDSTLSPFPENLFFYKILSPGDVSDEIPIKLPLSCPLFLLVYFSVFWFLYWMFPEWLWLSLSTYICLTSVMVSPRSCKNFLSYSFAYLRLLSDNQFLKYDSKFLFRQWSNLTIFRSHDRGVRKMGTYCCGLLLHILFLCCVLCICEQECAFQFQFSNFIWLLALIFIIISKRCVFTKSYGSCNDEEAMANG